MIVADKIHTVKQTDESCKCKFSPEDWMKIIGTITVALMCLAVTLLICFSIYKNGISVESILSMLLAFFSIFISIFFYFKADETSGKFYDNSYDFMKDQSVLLGRIEERFGEKFENLISRIDHLDVRKVEKESELYDVNKEISNIVDNLIQTIQTHNKSEKTDELLEQVNRYNEELTKKRLEYDRLVKSLQEMRQEAQDVSQHIKSLQLSSINSASGNMMQFFARLSEAELNYLLRCGGRIQRSNSAYRLARRYGFCDEKGWLSDELKEALLQLEHNMHYFSK